MYDSLSSSNLVHNLIRDKDRHILLDRFLNHQAMRVGEKGTKIKLGVVTPDGKTKYVDTEYFPDAYFKDKKILSLEPLLPLETIKEVYKSDSHTISVTKDNIAIVTLPNFTNNKLK